MQTHKGPEDTLMSSWLPGLALGIRGLSDSQEQTSYIPQTFKLIISSLLFSSAKQVYLTTAKPLTLHRRTVQTWTHATIGIKVRRGSDWTSEDDEAKLYTINRNVNSVGMHASYILKAD